MQQQVLEIHNRYLPQPIDWSEGDADALKNRYRFREYTTKPFIWSSGTQTVDSSVTVEDLELVNYLELNQFITAGGFEYAIRIYTAKKQHAVHVICHDIKNKSEVQLFKYIPAATIGEAKGISYNWYLNLIDDHTKEQNGFLIAEEKEEIEAPQTIFKTEPWSLRWIFRRSIYAFIFVVLTVQMIRHTPMLAFELGMYAGSSLGLVVGTGLFLAWLKKVFRFDRDRHYKEIDRDRRHQEEEPEMVSFPKAAKS